MIERTDRSGMPDPSAVAEYLVSSTLGDPPQAHAALRQFAAIAASSPTMTVVKTVGGESGLRLVVVSSTETDVRKLAGGIHGLQVEKNQPLSLF